MVKITKAEKDFIADNFPNVHIVRTMKGKSKRHNYYCEEARQVMRYLSTTRNESASKEVKSNGAKKKSI